MNILNEITWANASHAFFVFFKFNGNEQVRAKQTSFFSHFIKFMQLIWDFQLEIYNLNIGFVVIVRNRSTSAPSDILYSSILMKKQPIYDVFITISMGLLVYTKSDYLLAVLRYFSTVYRLRTSIQLENIHHVNFINFLSTRKIRNESLVRVLKLSIL